MTKGVIITELEGLEILECYGLSKGEEKQKKFYKDKGYINVGRSLDAYLQKIEQIYTYARLVINEKTGKPYTGTKRLIEIGTMREEMAQRYDGRVNNGGHTNEENDIMTKYVFNRLLEINEHKYLPYNSWTNKIELLDTSNLSNKEFKDSLRSIIDELHSSTLGHDASTTNKIVKEFNDTVFERNKSIIKTSFSRLETEEKIQVLEGYAARFVSGKYEVISKEEFEQLEIEENSILESYGLDREQYVALQKSTAYRNEDFYRIKDKITEHLKSKHDILYYYRTKRVITLDRTPYEDIDKDDMYIAYRKRFIDLTSSRGKKDSYKHAGELHKEWYVLNTFTLLKEMGIDIPEDEYEKELRRLQKDQDSVLFKEKRLTDDINEAVKIFDCYYE